LVLMRLFLVDKKKNHSQYTCEKEVRMYMEIKETKRHRVKNKLEGRHVQTEVGIYLGNFQCAFAITIK